MPTMKTIGTIAQCAGVAISAVAVCYPIVHAGAELLFGSSVVIAGLLMNPNSFCGMDARIVPRDNSKNDVESSEFQFQSSEFQSGKSRMKPADFMDDSSIPEDEEISHATDQFQMYYEHNDIMSANIDHFGRM